MEELNMKAGDIVEATVGKVKEGKKVTVLYYNDKRFILDEQNYINNPKKGGKKK